MARVATRRSPPVVDKRGRILDAALRRFSHYGFRRTSMEDLADETGISRAALYLHFANKEDVFRALALLLHERAAEEAERAAGTGGAVEARLERALLAKLGAFFQIMHGAAHARELLDENSRLCGDISATFRQRHLAVLRRVIERAAAAGELEPSAAGLSAAAAAELLLDSAKGIEVSGGATLTPALYQRRLRQLVRLVVLGLQGRSSREAVADSRRSSGVRRNAPP